MLELGCVVSELIDRVVWKKVPEDNDGTEAHDSAHDQVSRANPQTASTQTSSPVVPAARGKHEGERDVRLDQQDRHGAGRDDGEAPANPPASYPLVQPE